MFNTLSQFQSHVDQIAAKKNKCTVLEVKATFADNTVFTDTVEREEMQISRIVPAILRDYKGQTVEAYYSGTKFVDTVYSDGEPVTATQMKTAIKKMVE